LSFSEQLFGILMQNFARVLFNYSQVKMPKSRSLFLTATKLLNFFCNHIVISYVHMQQNVCIMKGARCLLCRKTQCHSNNIANSLQMNVGTRSVHHWLLHHLHIHLIFCWIFNSMFDGKLSQITFSACLSLVTDFSFGEKLSINAIKN